MELIFDMHGELGDAAGSASLAPGQNLSACPFCCGHDVEVVNSWTPYYWVRCNGCGAEGPHVHTTNKSTYATVAAAKRGHRKALVAAVKAWDQRL